MIFVSNDILRCICTCAVDSICLYSVHTLYACKQWNLHLSIALIQKLSYYRTCSPMSYWYPTLPRSRQLKHDRSMQKRLMLRERINPFSIGPRSLHYKYKMLVPTTTPISLYNIATVVYVFGAYFQCHRQAVRLWNDDSKSWPIENTVDRQSRKKKDEIVNPFKLRSRLKRIISKFCK